MTQTYNICLRILLLLSAAYASYRGPLTDQNAPSAPDTTRSATWQRESDESKSGNSGCITENINTSWAVEDHALKIEQHSLRMTETGTSDTDLYARNLESSPIQALALIIEYDNEQGQLIERVPVVASTQQAGEAFHPPFPFERVASIWNMPIAFGESVRVQGVSNGVKATTCPARSTITFIMVQFVDGTIKERSSFGWQLGPTPRVIPFVSEFPSNLVHPPVALLARVKISASGRVVDVVSARPEQPDVLSLIRDQMIQNWKFNPGLYEGRPAASELTVLFQIHSSRTLTFPEARPLPSPVTVISFFPDDNNPGKLQIAYGSLFSGSAVE